MSVRVEKGRGALAIQRRNPIIVVAVRSTRSVWQAPPSF